MTLENTAKDTGSSPSQNDATASRYSVVDPGYDAVDDNTPAETVLEELRAENTKVKPDAKADDASSSAADTSVGNETDETATTPANSEPVEMDIDDELLDRAVAAGYDLNDLRAFKSAEALKSELTRVERLQQRLQARTAEKAEESAKPNVTPDKFEEPNWDQMIEDGHDEQMVRVNQQNWQMAKQLQQIEQQRVVQAALERFDNVINKMPEEYEPILGKGNGKELQESSPTIFANRAKVYDKMIILRQGYQSAGRKMPSEQDLIKEAVYASFHEQTIKDARKQVRTQIQKSGSQGLSRPRSMVTKGPEGPSKALAIERDFWRRMSE